MKNRYIQLLICSLCCFCSIGQAQTTITVTPNKSFQTIEGIGGGIVYYLDWLTTHKNKEILYDTIFNGLGISALRMGNWAHEEDADLTYDAEIYKAAKDRLGDKCFMLMSSWSAPASLKANGKLSGTNGGWVTATLKKEHNNYVYDAFGQWWKRAIEQYHNVGVYPDYISIQNEPDCDADYEATVFSPTNYASTAHYGTALNSVYQYVNSMKDAPKIIGPEALGIGWNKVQEFINNLNKNQLSGYCFHYYHSGLNDHDGRDVRYSYPDDFIGAMSQLSKDYLGQKPMYVTENSSLRDRQELDPIYMATFLSYAFTINHAVSYMHWNLIWGDEGDGCINLDFDEKGYKSEDGYTIQGDYHALRHFSKFIQKGWVNIDAQTNNNNLIVSAFKSPDGKSYTLVIVNRGNYSQYVKLPFFPEGTEATVIRSIPKEKSWSKVIGTYSSLSDMNPPGNSITTIAYRPLSTRHTFRTEESEFWGNTLNWRPASIPQTTDTVVIRKGEVRASTLVHEAPIFIEKEGSLRLESSAEASEIRLSGGKIKTQTTNPIYQLHTNVVVYDTSTIHVGSISTTTLRITGSIAGEHDLTKTGEGILEIEADASQFSGRWIVNEGTLFINDSTGCGANGVVIYNGTLQTETNITIPHLSMDSTSTLVLNAVLTVEEADLNGKSLKRGTYTKEDLPDLIEGNGQLIVRMASPELVKEGPGDSTQTILLGEFIVPFHYVATHADSLTATWTPNPPAGLDVTYNPLSIYFSGTPTEEGVFHYSVSTQSDAYKEATESGSFTISKNGGEVSLPTLQSKKEEYLSAKYDGRELSISLSNNRGEENAHFIVADMTGVIWMEDVAHISTGENQLSYSIHLPSGCYLLQKRGKNGMKTIQFTSKP